MVRMDIAITWTLQLESPELRLVLKALYGKLESQDEKDEAGKLADMISRNRAGHTKSALESNEKLLKNLGN